MKFHFKAKIYKVGINPCVKVPLRITKKMVPSKGYIPVRGVIEKHRFMQTLCPVKNAAYRLYVNSPMLKGADVQVGDTVSFTLEQYTRMRKKLYQCHPRSAKHFPRTNSQQRLRNLHLHAKKKFFVT
jgi:hypothetical protein